MALVRAKLEAAKVSGVKVQEAQEALDNAQRIDRTGQRLEISDALRRSLAERKDE